MLLFSGLICLAVMTLTKGIILIIPDARRVLKHCDLMQRTIYLYTIYRKNDLLNITSTDKNIKVSLPAQKPCFNYRCMYKFIILPVRTQTPQRIQIPQRHFTNS